jgi:hypothetical protein
VQSQFSAAGARSKVVGSSALLAVSDSHGDNPNAAPAGSFLMPMFSSTKIAGTNQ